MKYIRTKDAIYQDLGTDNLGWRTILCGKHSQTLDPKENVINEADTIEELCDAFVYAKCDYMELEEALREKEWREVTFEQDESPIYGAIWTKGGLIYVAKLNEKGELELL